MFYIFVALVVISVARLIYIKNTIPDRVEHCTNIPLTYEEMEEEWSKLSRTGTDPWRVIILANEMGFWMSVYKANLHMSSAYYSQIKFLLKKLHLLTAIVFYLENREHADLALEEYNYTPESEKSPINLEVLGAPDFMLAKAPYVGWFIGSFGFKKRALEFLNTANAKLMSQKEGFDPLEAALIWSKLYALTKNEAYKLQIKHVGLNANMDEMQLLRVTKHLGFRDLGQLQNFCTRSV